MTGVEGSFWSYHLSRTALTTPDETDAQAAVKVLISGGLAGVVTWASIFPLGECCNQPNSALLLQAD